MRLRKKHDQLCEAHGNLISQYGSLKHLYDREVAAHRGNVRKLHEEMDRRIQAERDLKQALAELEIEKLRRQ